MFNIDWDGADGVRLEGRLDAASAGRARDVLSELDRSCRLDFSALDYIASAGLGVLIAAQRRLREQQQRECGRGSYRPEWKDRLSVSLSHLSAPTGSGASSDRAPVRDPLWRDAAA